MTTPFTCTVSLGYNPFMIGSVGFAGGIPFGHGKELFGGRPLSGMSFGNLIFIASPLFDYNAQK